LNCSRNLKRVRHVSLLQELNVGFPSSEKFCRVYIMIVNLDIVDITQLPLYIRD
jgi:hypothetical protein